MDLFEAIRSRRSVRRFQDRPVPPEILAQIFEAARWAPSWANTQCARFVAVSEPALKEALIETFSERNPARRGAAQAPILVALTARTGLSGFKQGLPVTDKGGAWYLFDTALAAQNLTLAAHALGLGTVHVGFFDAPAAARLLALPADEVAVELIPLGYPDQEPAAPPRIPLAELVRYR